jgi:hypothetical protein
MRQTGKIIFGTEFAVKYSCIGMRRMKIEKVSSTTWSFKWLFCRLVFSAVIIAVSEPFLLPAAELGTQLQDKLWHQDRILIFIAKPRWRSGSNHNMEL